MTKPVSRLPRRVRERFFGLVTMTLGAGCQPAAEAPPEPITIRLVNRSAFVVDPNLYAAAGTLTETELFGGGHLVTSFTDGGLATVPAHETRTVELACEAARTVGVRSPVFSDPVGFAGGGTADASLILHEGTDYTCGRTIVFTYQADGGTFKATFGFQ